MKTTIQRLFYVNVCNFWLPDLSKKIVLLHFWNLLIERIILVYNSQGNEENEKVVEERVNSFFTIFYLGY